jgi:hypothetical protein
MTIKQIIDNSLILEDNAEAYAYMLNAKVLSKTLKLETNNDVSYINFNNERIKKSIKVKDFILNYPTEKDFAQNVLKAFLSKNASNEYLNNLIIRASIDYYRKFKKISHHSV